MTCWNPLKPQGSWRASTSLWSWVPKLHIVIVVETVERMPCWKSWPQNYVTQWRWICVSDCLWLLVTVSVERYWKIWKCNAFLYSFGDLLNLVNRNHPLDVLKNPYASSRPAQRPVVGSWVCPMWRSWRRRMRSSRNKKRSASAAQYVTW